jgi:hypothetical protein
MQKLSLETQRAQSQIYEMEPLNERGAVKKEHTASKPMCWYRWITTENPT